MNTKTYGLQNETRQYLRRLYSYGRELRGEDINDIDEFIKGLKQLNLWNNCLVWPTASNLNVSFGSTVLNFGGLGLYNGLLINGGSWSPMGINFLLPGSYISTNFNMNNFNGWSIFSSAYNKEPGQGYFGRLFSCTNNLNNNFIVVRTSNNSVLNAFNFQSSLFVNGNVSTTVPQNSYFTSLVTFDNRVNGLALLFGAGGMSSWLYPCFCSIIINKKISNQESNLLHLLFKNTIGKNLGLL